MALFIVVSKKKKKVVLFLYIIFHVYGNKYYIFSKLWNFGTRDLQKSKYKKVHAWLVYTN